MIFASLFWTITGWALLAIGLLGMFLIGVFIFEHRRQIRDLQKMREEADQKRNAQTYLP